MYLLTSQILIHKIRLLTFPCILSCRIVQIKVILTAAIQLITFILSVLYFEAGKAIKIKNQLRENLFTYFYNLQRKNHRDRLRLNNTSLKNNTEIHNKIKKLNSKT